MQTIDMIIDTEHMYTMQGSGVGYLNHHALAIDAGKIIAIAPREAVFNAYKAEKTLDARNKVVLPGFIDGHTHAGEGILRGLAQDIKNWMIEGMAPLIVARSVEAKLAGTHLAIAESVMSGTTTIGDDGLDMEGPICFIKRIGVRGNISCRIRDAIYRVYDAGELYDYDDSYGQRTLEDALRLYDKYHDAENGRIKIRFGPQGADFVSKKRLLEVRELAKARKTKIHMHLEQGPREIAQMNQRYGLRSIPWLNEMGYFDRDFVGIHLYTAEEEHVRLVVDRGISMILCPNSIGLLCATVPPAKLFRELGGMVGMGTDQTSGNNSHNMFNEMKFAALSNKIKYHDPVVMPCWQVLRMATIEGAKALGIDDITGSLEAGKSADLIMIDLNCTTMRPIYLKPMRNLIPNLVYSAKGSEVDTVVVAGQIIVENKEPRTFNLQKILCEAQDYANELGEKVNAEFWKIHGQNAIYMEEGKL